MNDIQDIFIVGGGINGVGIARDAAGRGYTVTLVEMGDLAQATSSSSTKLFHGGLRYLEFFEFRLVKKALIEREVLLKAMPHISWPMRFVLPYHKDMRFETETPASNLLNRFMPWMRGRRPAWMIRLGLLIYDTLGGREILPGTKKLNLRSSPEGTPLKQKFQLAYEYSDCWIEDSRLVVLNARDAQERGAKILTRTTLTKAERADDHWVLTTEANGEEQTHRARVLVNAGGPWVSEIIQGRIRLNSTEGIRLVRGSHIVTRRLFDHEKCYFFQGKDGRIIFAIPYETDFTLIGTTDQDHGSDPGRPAVCTDEEADYLCAFASDYFKNPVTRDDVIWSYSGVRPLYDDGATSATAATRDYVLSLDTKGPPVLNIFGGKITTYRTLSESAMARIVPHLPEAKGNWTAGMPLPGGDFPIAEFDKLVENLAAAYPFLEARWAKRLVRAYGTEAAGIVEGATKSEDLGEAFGATLTAREIDWLMAKEYAQTAEDVVWRRSKLGLRLNEEEIARIDTYMTNARAPKAGE